MIQKESLLGNALLASPNQNTLEEQQTRVLANLAEEELVVQRLWGIKGSAHSGLIFVYLHAA